MRNIFLSLLFGIVCNLFVIEAKNSLVSDFVVSREENPKNTVYRYEVCHEDKFNVNDEIRKGEMPRSGFEVGKGTFLLNGKPFIIKAAELHYPRIPKPYWEQRIKLCKALGMNTICVLEFA